MTALTAAPTLFRAGTLPLANRRATPAARAVQLGLTLKSSHGTELIIDNFAGGGGASTGIEMALGQPVDIAINHDPEAVALHLANHPRTEHFCESVWTVDPAKATGGRPVGLAWFSPDCFPAGTLVLTERGYWPIEDINVGDRVLTHRGRWRAVTATSTAVRPLLNIRGHGHPGLRVSPEHPFYTRTRQDEWSNNRRADRRRLSTAEWAPASVLAKGSYWASPLKFQRLPVPDVPGRGMPLDRRLMWLAGRYLGDGWTRLTDTRAELVLVCGRHEADDLRTRLADWHRSSDCDGFGELAWRARQTRTSTQFATSHRGLVAWLRQQFGHGGAAKRIPGWALGMRRDLRQALLAGYVGADGYTTDQFVECHTASRAIAFGIAALASSLGHTPTAYQAPPNSTRIENRDVSARPMWKLRWRHRVADGHAQTERTDLHEWRPVRDVVDTNEHAPVFNISVDGDESYVVEGVVVHNCKHFSKAKGAALISRKIRGLAWIVLKWAGITRPRVIILENVEEFVTWGPLVAARDPATARVILANGRVAAPGDVTPIAHQRLVPDRSRKGSYFTQWVQALRALGYQVEWRELRACDYGAPTNRKRLFVIARCDGDPIVWPEPTHGPGRPQPWRTAAEIIDWTLPCPSIFAEGRDLVDNTMARIGAGIVRYVITAKDPFLVLCNHGRSGFRGQGIRRPMRTVTASRDAHGVVVPYLAKLGQTGGNGTYANDSQYPLTTIVSKAEHLLIAPYLVPRYGERPGQEPRNRPVTEPAATVVTTANGDQLVTAVLAKHRGTSDAASVAQPRPAATTQGTQVQLVAPLLTKFNENSTGQPLDDPVHTVMPGAGRFGLVAGFLAQHNTGEVGHDARRPVSTIVGKGCTQAVVATHLTHPFGATVGQAADDPAPTDTTVNKTGLVAAHLTKLYSSNTGSGGDLSKPAGTVTASGQHLGLVYAFLIKYYGAAADGQGLRDPLHTVTVRGRFGLVQAAAFDIAGQRYLFDDVGMRMLTPRELYRAQGFPDSYQIAIEYRGKVMTKTAQIRMAGNSVCPPVAAALVAANYQRRYAAPVFDAAG